MTCRPLSTSSPTCLPSVSLTTRATSPSYRVSAPRSMPSSHATTRPLNNTLRAPSYGTTIALVSDIICSCVFATDSLCQIRCWVTRVLPRARCFQQAGNRCSCVRANCTRRRRDAGSHACQELIHYLLAVIQEVSGLAVQTSAVLAQVSRPLILVACLLRRLLALRQLYQLPHTSIAQLPLRAFSLISIGLSTSCPPFPGYVPIHVP